MTTKSTAIARPRPVLSTSSNGTAKPSGKRIALDPFTEKGFIFALPTNDFATHVAQTYDVETATYSGAIMSASGRKYLVIAPGDPDGYRDAANVARQIAAGKAEAVHLVRLDGFGSTHKTADEWLKNQKGKFGFGLSMLIINPLVPNGDTVIRVDRDSELPLLTLFPGAPLEEEWPAINLNAPPEVAEFPVEVFPEYVRAYCREVAAATLAPIDFVGSSMILVAGAAMGQSRNVMVKNGWFESSMLNVVHVAKPGRAKSPVGSAVTKPLAEIDRKLRAASAKARKDWLDAKRLHERNSNAPHPGDEPPQLRATVKDITRESLAMVLKDNPRGVLCDPDEASGWVASMNEYKGKGGADRQFWLSTWSCKSISVDRKGGRESIYVPFPFVSVLGGVQPDLIHCFTADNKGDDGFLDRILFVYPDKFPKQEWTDAEVSMEASNTWDSVINALFKQDMEVKAGSDLPTPIPVRFSAEAKTRWIEWFNQHSSEMDSPEFHDRHSGAWSKMRAHCARFALILYGIRTADDPGADQQISLADVEGAIKLADYFKSHLARVSFQLKTGDRSSELKPLMQWILKNNKNTFRIADINKDLRCYREDEDSLSCALKRLVDSGVIRHIPEEIPPGKRGRRPSPLYETNPAFLSQECAGK